MSVEVPTRHPEPRRVLLDYPHRQAGHCGSGALRDLLEWAGLADQTPLLARALPFVGHFQTRNRGTVCGSIAASASIPSSRMAASTAEKSGWSVTSKAPLRATL